MPMKLLNLLPTAFIIMLLTLIASRDPAVAAVGLGLFLLYKGMRFQFKSSRLLRRELIRISQKLSALDRVAASLDRAVALWEVAGQERGDDRAYQAVMAPPSAAGPDSPSEAEAEESA